MPLLKVKYKEEDKQIRIRLKPSVMNEIESYCKWVGLKDISAFLEQSAAYILKKDKGWISQKNISQIVP
jgi:hypothetical protein